MVKALIFLILLLPLACPAQKKQHRQKLAEQWSSYGNDAGGKRFSTLDQVNHKNVHQMRVAWTFRTDELETYPKGSEFASKAAFEATPLMIGRTLYFSTPSCRVFALDAETGEKKWLFDPQIDLNGNYSEATSRGVSVWPQPGTALAAKHKLRIILPVVDGRLIALDASTGKPIASFGHNGVVDLTENLGRISITSPPAIIHNLIVVGSSLGDNERADYERGVVRAYNAINGKSVWSWDPIPRNPVDSAYQSWKGSNWQKTGAANAWSIISADPKRDLVFIPTSSPSPDYYGGLRLGPNRYANSIVAIRASTGKMVWQFQTVHHDLWDYDNAAQPLLFDLPLGKTKVPAVAVGTKMGHIFILHRETGIPLFPVEERPVPQSTIPGEVASPTQPFPMNLPRLGLQNVTVDSAWGLTPADSAAAAKRISTLRWEGTFTPPSQDGSLIAPGNIGGIHWGGMTYDPQQNLLVTNVNRLAAIVSLRKREELAILKKGNEQIRAEIGLQKGTPYIMLRDYLFEATEHGLVIQTKPPWGTLVAINLYTGKLQWEVPIGHMLDIKKIPNAAQWGSLNLGGAICTSGDVAFIAATMDNHIRAFRSSNGKLLWESLLPASAQATPMTYAINNRQFVVIAAGGHGKMRTKTGDYIIAYALPKTQ